jgi:predicted ribosome quality control (RQC) complex YloA/Tae2 family protein
VDARGPGLALQRQRGARLKALRAAHVGELIAELRPLLAGTRVREVQALPPRDLLLIVEPEPLVPDGPPVLRLRLSADPNAPRLHLQQGRVLAHKGPAGPFFRRLEQELAGARLRGLEQVGGDRLVLVEFDQTPLGGRRALVLELVGRHANLILLGPNDRVLDLLVPPPKRAQGGARLALGEPWSPPGGAAKPQGDPGPGLTELIPAPDDPPPGKVKDRAPLSWRVESSLGGEAAGARRAQLAKDLGARAKRRLGRARGLVKGLEVRAEKAADADRVRQDGELLKATMGELRRGMETIELQDWFAEGAPLRRISLDPRRSPQANVERLFDRFHKLERARESVAAELELARAKAQGLEQLLERLADPDSDPESLSAEAVQAGLMDERQQGDVRKRKAAPPRLPYRSFTVAGGAQVRVGRSAKDNDSLTFQHARGNDLWLHTADCPGSHVILRVEKGQEPDPEALIDAALLAVHFSPARGGDGIPVHLAPRKVVHKPRGAKAGLVTLSGGRILRVRAQQERLEAVLRAARGREAPPSRPS